MLDAVLSGDEAAVDGALEALLARVAPETMLLKRIAASGWVGHQLELARRVDTWAAGERAGRTDSSRARTRELNAASRARFSRVSVAIDGRYVEIEGTGNGFSRDSVRFKPRRGRAR